MRGDGDDSFIEQNRNEDDDEDEGKLRDVRSNFSYHRALQILANPTYHLIDAYPVLYQAYGKILTIPFTSCTPERTFSVLKRL